jgi:(p)ppGpp synthase/HD superfamily hydrolase
MTTFRRSPADTLIVALGLKEMDSSLLSRAIILGAFDAGLSAQPFTDAISFAAYVHRKDTRAQRAGMPRVHYLEHPLRNTLRLMRYGCADPAVLIASILHDTVEDHAEEIAREFTGVTASGEQGARELALAYVQTEFGLPVSKIVRGVSNPFHPAGLSKKEKHEAYCSHVTEAIADVRVALVKFSDFVDNAFSLNHTLSPTTRDMVAGLASKYAPLVIVFEDRLSRADIAEFITPVGRKQIAAHIVAGRATLRELNRA